MEFWGSSTDVGITTTSGTKTLGNISLPNLTGLTIEAVYLGVFVQSVYNSYANRNYLGATSNMQVKESAAGSWTTGMTFANESFHITGATYQPCGIRQFGATDVKGEVAAFNKTYNFQCLTMQAAGNNLELKDTRPLLMLIVSK